MLIVSLPKKAFTFNASLISAAGLITVFAAAVFSTPEVNASLPPCIPFNDVPVSHNFHDEICLIRFAGVVNGYPGNLYKPQNHVTRGEMAKFIFYFGIPTNTTCGDFPDVPNGAPFYTEITSLKCANVVSGYPQNGGPNVYKPNNKVTRGEIAKFIKTALDIPTNTTCTNFPDVPNGAPFHTEITTLKCAGIVSGYPQIGGPNIYKPNNNITRGEMAKLLAPFIN